jgi:CO/xanthine dehydrogenase FAD-binding subunit
MRPQGLCLPIISMAARLQVNDGRIVWFAEPAAEVLVGKPASPAQFEKAADVALQHVSLRTSKYRATEQYRETMIRTYLPIILSTAAERAGAEL